MLNNFKLAAKLLRRELNLGEWFAIFLTLVLTITAVTGLHFYTDRVLRGVVKKNASILGGDLVISSPTPIPANWIKYAMGLKLATAQVMLYPTMIEKNGKLTLINLQAVSSQYPLFDNIHFMFAPNSIWIDARLLTLLNVKPGSNVKIGAANFKIQKVLSNESTILNAQWIIAPIVIMNIDDVAKTKTIVPGSRIEYRFLLRGKSVLLSSFKNWIKPQLKANQQLLEAKYQKTFLNDAILQMKRFIELGLLISIVMSSVAIALSVFQHMRRHYSYIALWKTLGATRSQIVGIFFWQLVLVGLIAGLLGIFLGYFAQGIFAKLFKEYFNFPLPPLHWLPVFSGFLTSYVLLFAFSYPIMSELPKTSALFIWRNETRISPLQTNLTFFISIFLLTLFLWWLADFSLVTLFFIDCIVLIIGFLYVISILLLTNLKRMLFISRGTIKQGLSQLTQHAPLTALQLTGFTLVVACLFILNAIRTHLVQDWYNTLPKDAPNYFVFNLRPEDIVEFKSQLLNQKIKIDELYPMVKGRLIALNGQPILTAIPASGRDSNALYRELNLSWMNRFPSDNQITTGVMWQRQDAGKAWVSVEKTLADKLNLKLNDILTFQIADQTISAKIINLRSLKWSSFNPNFYMIFPPGFLNQFPTTYITSFYMPDSKKNFLNQISLRFPNATIIDISNLIRSVQNLISKIALVMQYLFSFIIVLAILVFMICIRISIVERKRTYYLWHVLGANKNYIYKTILVEFVSMSIIILVLSWVLNHLITFALLNYFL